MLIMARRSSSAKHFDLVDFVRGAEAVKEVQERNAGFEAGCMRDQRHVHSFLDRVGAQHRRIP